MNGTRSTLLLALVFWAVTLVPVWSFDYFPGQDTPNHLYAVHVHTQVDGPAFTKHFAARASASNATFHTLAAGLTRVCDLATAHRLILSLYLLAFIAGALYLAASTGRERLPLGLLAAPFALNGFLTLGLYNYCLSLPLFCFAVGTLLRHPALPPRALAAVGVCALLCAITHVETLGAILLSALVLAPRWRALARLAPALLPAAALALLGSDGVFSHGFDWPDGFKSPWYTLAHGLAVLVTPLGMAELPATGAALLVLLVPALRTALRRGSAAPRPASARLLVLFVVLVFVLPEHSFGLFQISTRLTILLVLLVPSFADYAWLLVRPRLLVGVAALLHTASVGLFCVTTAGVNEDLREYVAGRAAIAKGKTLLPLNFEPRGGTRVHTPLLHAWGYYGVERDAAIPYVFNARRALARVAMREESPLRDAPPQRLVEAVQSGAACRRFGVQAGGVRDCVSFDAALNESIARAACGFDYLLTWALPPAFETRLARCFEPAFSRGRLRIYRRSAASSSPR